MFPRCLTKPIDDLKACKPFVLVLIDGDDTKVRFAIFLGRSSQTLLISFQFLDKFVKNGVQGGQDAVRELRQAVFHHFKNKSDFQYDFDIVIRVYSNMEGLSNAYYQAKLLAEPAHFRPFVQGFNKSQELCDYLDAGNDKEGADTKIKGENRQHNIFMRLTESIATMELFFWNAHCKHIMLGGSGDNSYAGFLRKFTLTDQVCERITLLEALPFASGLEELASKFQVTSFRHVFRDTKLLTRRVSFQDQGNRPPKSPSVSYATTVSKAPAAIRAEANSVLPKSPSSPALESKPATAELQPRRIYLNSRGQRVDQPVRYNKILMNPLQARKLCNRHFLTRCNFVKCTHSHEGKLTDDQLETLKHIARQSPCYSIWCEDPDCVNGHRCIHDPKCDRGSNCRFPEEMHSVDNKVVRSIVV